MLEAQNGSRAAHLRLSSHEVLAHISTPPYTENAYIKAFCEKNAGFAGHQVTLVN